jgi:hypothetical protein
MAGKVNREDAQLARAQYGITVVDRLSRIFQRDDAMADVDTALGSDCEFALYDVRR